MTVGKSVSARIKTLTPVFKKRVDKFGRYDIIKCGHLYGGCSVAGLTRQFVALKIVGSNPISHPKTVRDNG